MQAGSGQHSRGHRKVDAKNRIHTIPGSLIALDVPGPYVGLPATTGPWRPTVRWDLRLVAKGVQKYLLDPILTVFE